MLKFSSLSKSLLIRLRGCSPSSILLSFGLMKNCCCCSFKSLISTCGPLGEIGYELSWLNSPFSCSHFLLSSCSSELVMFKLLLSSFIIRSCSLELCANSCLNSFYIWFWWSLNISLLFGDSSFSLVMLLGGVFIMYSCIFSRLSSFESGSCYYLFL